jgi:SagB-type dehydrogenase family enzyme
MRKYLKFRVMIVILLFLIVTFFKSLGGGKMQGGEKKIKLPVPRHKSTVSVEEAILNRRSVRSYSKEPLNLEEISQLLWAAQGITDGVRNLRAAPSAGALYPLETYIVVGNVSSLEDGIYKYNPLNHEIINYKEGDCRSELSLAALGQSCVRNGAVSIIFAAVYDRITEKYGNRGIMYTYMEAGHAAQNIYLQAEALELGTVVVGAFIDDKVKEVIGMKEEETPLYILPVGKK